MVTDVLLAVPALDLDQARLVAGDLLQRGADGLQVLQRGEVRARDVVELLLDAGQETVDGLESLHHAEEQVRLVEGALVRGQDDVLVERGLEGGAGADVEDGIVEDVDGAGEEGAGRLVGGLRALGLGELAVVA
ncbi:MAG: hypothetical protein IPI35_24680 [Deltaproteobacteria bacterium]|nr:hypothetical protein [Deltaproteobacteria bacterium]